MSKALKWIRKSKGNDDDIGLEEQRDVVVELANGMADEVDELDLGVHTGFSTLTREDGADLLDQNDKVTDAVDRIRAGEYDYIVAWDDRRVCRDEYYAVIKHAATQGEAEFVFVEDVADDDLTHDIRRRIERETKEEEIRKAKRALKRRRENGYYEGRPRWGTQYDDASKYLEPAEEFEEVLTAFRMRDEGASYTEILEETNIPARATVSNILDRREWYLELGRLHAYEVDDLVDEDESGDAVTA